MKLYFKYVEIAFKGLIQYPLNFIATFFGQMATTALGFIGVYMLFMRFDNLAGYSFSEVALCYSVSFTVFAFTECFFRGFDRFSNMIVKGTFDLVLVKPRSEILHILGSTIEFSRLGRMITGIVILVLSVNMADIRWNIYKGIAFILMLAGGTAVFSGLFILGASFCFVTVQGIEVVNIFTDGGREFASYPLTIYEKWAVKFFTYVIPYACFNYIPLAFITDKAVDYPQILYMLSPLVCFIFFIPCIVVWKISVRHYLSTGS